jgi:hypothetical protein
MTRSEPRVSEKKLCHAPSSKMDEKSALLVDSCGQRFGFRKVFTWYERTSHYTDDFDFGSKF